MARAGLIVVWFAVVVALSLVGADDSVAVIERVCSSTRYPASCLDAFLQENRWRGASAQALVEGMTKIASQRSRAAKADAQTLATCVAPAASDANLTAVAAGCTQLLDLADHYVGLAHAGLASASLEDAQAWLSGALTQSFDCYYSLTKLSLPSTLSTSGLAFVAAMTDRMNSTVELISNALALTSAWLAFGPDPSLWRPPPESRAEQLQRLAMPPICHHRPSRWITNADRAAAVDKRVANVTVALNSSQSSIQAAVDNAPSWSPNRFVIYITAGVYEEIVRVPKDKTNITFLGDGSNVTVITGSLHVQSPGITTWLSATVGVSGAGFVSRGITFENTAGPERHQAVALRVESDRSAFHDCSILGHQDSLYAHSLRQFYEDCTVAGTVDFIFGNAAAVFQACNIVVRVRNVTTGASSTSLLTAQGRMDPAQSTALVFWNCSVDGTAEYKALRSEYPGRHRVYLGRPWRAFSRTVFFESFFSSVVEAQGWMTWNGSFALETLLDAEYGSRGPGAANLSQRVLWSTQLSFQQAQSFSSQRLLQADSWLPPPSVSDTHKPLIDPFL